MSTKKPSAIRTNEGQPTVDILKGHRKLSHGWQPDLPDVRDYRFSRAQDVTLPPSVDLRPNCPPIYDQGQLGSCTANAIGAAVEFEMAKQGESPVMPSRLFIYYEERVAEHTVEQDAGAQIRDGIKVVAKKGVPPESIWPYDVSKFAHRPPHTAFAAAKKMEALQYLRLNSADPSALMGCLAGGSPFVLGFSVYTAFESAAVAKSGILNLPGKTEKLLGGHAVLCVGYDLASRRFIIRNSWGTSWGQQGYFTIPFDYLTNPNLADDFWTIGRVS